MSSGNGPGKDSVIHTHARRAGPVEGRSGRGKSQVGCDDARRKSSHEEEREREETYGTDCRRGIVDGIGHRILQREGRRCGDRGVEGGSETGEASAEATKELQQKSKGQ